MVAEPVQTFVSETEPRGPDEPIHAESVEQFEELTGRDGVVLVDFHAEWCGPCKMIEPAVAGVARETNATVAKVDTDAHRDLAAQYGVQGVPNLVFFADGEPKTRVVGVQDQASLEGVVEQLGA